MYSTTQLQHGHFLINNMVVGYPVRNIQPDIYACNWYACHGLKFMQSHSKAWRSRNDKSRRYFFVDRGALRKATITLSLRLFSLLF